MAELLSAMTDYKSWPTNLSNQLNSILQDSKSVRTWINISIILGGYMLIRPLIIKFFAKTQFKNTEAKQVLDAGLTKGSDQWEEGLVSANALRSKKGGFGSGEDGVRRREKREKEVLGKIKQGKAADEDLLDLLVDYDEGEDGW